MSLFFGISFPFRSPQSTEFPVLHSRFSLVMHVSFFVCLHVTFRIRSGNNGREPFSPWNLTPPPSGRSVIYMGSNFQDTPGSLWQRSHAHSKWFCFYFHLISFLLLKYTLPWIAQLSSTPDQPSPASVKLSLAPCVKASRFPISLGPWYVLLGPSHNTSVQLLRVYYVIISYLPLNPHEAPGQG